MKNIRMITIAVIVICLASLTSLLWGTGEISVTSTVPGVVYVNGVRQGDVTPEKGLGIEVKDPGPYLVEVSGNGTKLLHREEITLDPTQNERRFVQAFSEDVSPVTPGTPDPTPVVETPAPDPQGQVTREELHQAVNQAASRAKAEALAEEAARRRRAQKREVTQKAITHVIGVEGRRLPSGVKDMERIKLLGELIPRLGGK